MGKLYYIIKPFEVTKTGIIVIVRMESLGEPEYSEKASLTWVSLEGRFEQSE